MKRYSCNSPASHRKVKNFLDYFPNAVCMGSVSLGSKKKTYWIDSEKELSEIDILFIKNLGFTSLKERK